VSPSCDRLPPLRVIRYPHPVCWDTRQAIEAHMLRTRIACLLTAARSRPQLLTVPPWA